MRNSTLLRYGETLYLHTGYMIDPHTAVAKFVADKHNFGSEVPLVISSTAHFSKFSTSVLDAFSIHAGTDNPQNLMKKVLDLTEKPAIHKNLWQDVQQSRHHKIVNSSQLHVTKYIVCYIISVLGIEKYYHNYHNYVKLGCYMNWNTLT